MNFFPAVVIPAAGRSSRMGQPKLLLPWGESTVIAHLLAQWKNLVVSQTAVVVASDQTNLATELDRLNFPSQHRILNPQPDLGMFTSIQCAARWSNWLPEISHVVITLGDQPHLRESTLRALLISGIENPAKISQPLFQGRRKHPVLLPRRAFAELADCSATTFKEFLQQRNDQIIGFEVYDPGIDLDMDTPADYDRVRKLSFGSP